MKIEQISSDEAEKLCRLITDDLPEYFGLPEVNKSYAKGVRDRINFAAKVDDEYVGLLSLEFPYPDNANIYWMGVLRKYHGHGFGSKLIKAAEDFALKKDARTITVETVSKKECDAGYLKTYEFYVKTGFAPMFDLKPKGYECNMVYMVKNLRSRGMDN